MKKYILGIITGVLIMGTVSAVLLYHAEDVIFTPKNEEWNVSSVEQALNDLEQNYISKSEFVGKIWEFKAETYSQEFNPLVDGTYKLEVWGAQGGTPNGLGGYGGYSVGEVYLTRKDTIYVTVGGTTSNGNGGYNGGGTVRDANYGGGGATHIATQSGELKTLKDENNNILKDKILIVAGGGGGFNTSGNNQGGSGGGFKGVAGSGDDAGGAGTQTEGGSTSTSCSTSPINATFGSGATNSWKGEALGAGGGGFYGGGAGGGNFNNGSGGGGSGYIENELLENAIMYCYGCAESTAKLTKTISTTGNTTGVDKTHCPSGYFNEAISKCAKSGSGFARITLISVENK